MANINAPYGFRPVRHLLGADIRTESFTIASAYGTSIGIGDVVEHVSDGTIGAAAAGNTDNIGIFAGCQYTDANGHPQWGHWPASTTATGIIAQVWCDPFIIFRAMISTVAAGDIFAGADHVTGTVNTTSHQSAAYLGTIATSGKSFRILKIVESPGNAAGSYAEVEVQLAEHAFLTTTMV